VADFSPATFVTEYSKMSPKAREVLFSTSPDAMKNLDALVRVSSRLRQADRAANTSNTATTGLAVASVGGLIANAPVTATTLVAGGATGRLLMSPTFTRILVNLAEIETRRAGNMATAPGARAVIALSVAQSLEPEYAVEYQEAIEAIEAMGGMSQVQVRQ
jgi:hypothetical protein